MRMPRGQVLRARRAVRAPVPSRRAKTSRSTGTPPGRCAGRTILRFRSEPGREVYGGRARRTTRWMRWQGWGKPQPGPRHRRSHRTAAAIHAERVGGVRMYTRHLKAPAARAHAGQLVNRSWSRFLRQSTEMSRHMMIVSLTRQTGLHRQRGTSVAGGWRTCSMLIDGYRRAACRVGGTGRRISRR